MALPGRVTQDGRDVLAAGGIGVAGPLDASVPHARGTTIEGMLDELVFSKDKPAATVHQKGDVWRRLPGAATATLLAQ